MNRYPLWKYLLILIIVAGGFLYAMPNIYPPDPAIQISSAQAGQEFSTRDMAKATKVLKAANIEFFGEENTNGNGLIRFSSIDDQLKAQRLVQETLGEREYIVAVNLAPTTPKWLTDLGAGPMKLGLDLAGGVHFLLEVDTPQVLAEELDGAHTFLKDYQQAERIHDVRLQVGERDLTVRTKSEEIRDQFASYIKKELSQLEFVKSEANGDFLITAKLTDSYIQEREKIAVEQNLTALRKRVNELGVSEPLVQRQGRNRIVVQLPGIQDTTRAKAVIGKTASLEFRMEAEATEFSTRKELYPYKDEVKQARTGGAYLEKKVIIEGKHVKNAMSSFDPETSLPQINITLNSEGGTLMNRATRDNIGRRLGVLFIEYHTRTQTEIDENGKEVKTFTQIPEKSVISLATVQDALNASFRITGIENPQEASELALLLRAGALAAPMGFVEERTIGPSLGAANIEKGVKSVQLGLGLVLIFMLVYYRAFGFAANIALAVNLVLLVAIMSIFGATLTLPGIAGIVLTVGMAVDANVLIFSRIREELKEGMPPQSAIKAGFDRAFTTILDANITTFIVAIILYAIGSGPVKGFAVTLAIGIITSMFTAIMGTRAIVNLIYGNRQVQKLLI